MDGFRPEDFLKFYQNISVDVELYRKASVFGIITFTVNHGQKFALKFTHGYVLHDDIEVDVDGSSVNIVNAWNNEVHMYRAVCTEPSKCSAVVRLFEGNIDITIQTKHNSFVVEPRSRYFIERSPPQPKNVSSSRMTFDSIFYSSNDVSLKLNHSVATFPPNSSFLYDLHATGSLPISKRRMKRSSFKTECLLHIIADHTFYLQTGKTSVTKTIAEIVYMTEQADLIFRSTDFDGDGMGDTVGVSIKKITVYQNETYHMAKTEDVTRYLETFSEYNFDNFCLASVFTSRDFDGGVVGLAWMASSNLHGSPGGICQRPIFYKGKRIWTNTNLVTNVNAGRILPSFLTALTFAHEIGHNFGSPHDDSQNPSCVPNSAYGNYLMYPYTSDANKPNNFVFSPCSISYIYPVLETKGTCLTDRAASICGNGEIEAGEECDCGSSEMCHLLDHCCTPSDAKGADRPCTIKRSTGNQCSPLASVCCSSSCRYRSTGEMYVCQDSTECTLPAICTTNSSNCPSEKHVSNGTLCDNGRKACLDGKCMGSVCTATGYASCVCSGDLSCFECCLDADMHCKPAQKDSGEYIYRSKGISCNDRNGFCDKNGECVSLDPESTIKRLYDMFSRDEAEKVKEWFSSHWYYILIGMATLAGLCLLFVKTCRRNRDVQTNAYLLGRFAGIQREAELQKAYLERRRASIQAEYQRKIENIGVNTLSMGVPKALARLMVFFPTVEPRVLLKTLEMSANEETAVKSLLIRKYPFRRLCKPLSNKKRK
ncbi:hypothetical protein DPMN_101519 [Dreissena polymorpha]|uniref:Disintegrin and metalloproteinase domain-containing protein 10 n=2 Tax=Dreissena polymorpha TaxID=45954 RepID=A0A9D4LJ28_DREPO|nr:hypothetical protein DPMN_101519 [Dreissena polymorpha]